MAYAEGNWTTLQRKPRKGDAICFPDSGARGVVIEAKDDGICWFMPDGAEKASTFIWRFREGFNTLVRVGGGAAEAA